MHGVLRGLHDNVTSPRRRIAVGVLSMILQKEQTTTKRSQPLKAPDRPFEA